MDSDGTRGIDVAAQGVTLPRALIRVLCDAVRILRRLALAGGVAESGPSPRHVEHDHRMARPTVALPGCQDRRHRCRH